MSGLTLLLLRHAKSSWDHPGLADFDRPLNERGRRAAAEIGLLLLQRGLAPSRVLCSNAARAQQTLAGVLEQLPERPELIHTRGIYEADPTRLLQLIRTGGGSSTPLMLIGHNPGIEMLAEELTGGGSLSAIGRLQVKYPTAGLAVLTFDTERWSEISPRSGRLEAFYTPRQHKGD